MTKESRISFFWRSALVAFAYGLAYASLREISLAGITAINWIPIVALRFICLLLIPPRYWPALVVGEAIPIGYFNYLCVEQFGWAWALTGSAPPTIYFAAIIHVIRKQFPNFEKHISQYISQFLLCVFLVSLTVALHAMLNYSLIKQPAPDEPPVALLVYGSRVATSSYLSILTITPVLLLLAEGFQHVSGRNRFRPSSIVETLYNVHWRATGGLLATIALLTILGCYVRETIHSLALCGILATLIAAAWRHGWKSAALVGAAANLGVIILMPAHDDPLTIQAQCIIAALLSGALLLGARTTSSRKLEHSAASAKRLARRELFTMERMRLDHAAVLEALYSDTHEQAMRVMKDASKALPALNFTSHYLQLDILQSEHKRITTGMSPHVYWPFGGRRGPIEQTLREIGVQCQLLEPTMEDGVTRLSAELRPALYRLNCEATAYLMKHAPTHHVCLEATVRLQDGRPLVEATLDSKGRPMPLSKTTFDDLLVGLGVSYLSERRLRERARLYDGDVEISRPSTDRMRIVVRVMDKALR